MNTLYTCANCGNKHIMFRLYCKSCGCILPDALDDTLPLSEKVALPADVVWGRSYFHPFARFILHRDETEIQFSLERGPVMIGRATANFKPTLCFSSLEAEELGISRSHARIERVDNKALLTDLGSTNGTFLDGARLVPKTAYILHNHAAIQLGKLVLRVEFR